MPSLRTELPLLGLLALLWGSSYLFIKVAVAEIPPLSLIALRVAGAAVFLSIVATIRRARLPTDIAMWRELLVLSFFSSIGAWTVLAWGQQHVEAALASVLNSTAPIFVFAFAALARRGGAPGVRQLAGAIVGVVGVVLIVGTDALAGLGSEVAGQLACLLGAALYACAALYGRRFASLGPLVTATCTMLIATAVLVPVALVVDRPWHLAPSAIAWQAAAALSIVCTGVAPLLYFRLLNSLGPMGVASQAYLRASVGVLLGVVLLGETLTPSVIAGLVSAIVGVALINWPAPVRAPR